MAGWNIQVCFPFILVDLYGLDSRDCAASPTPYPHTPSVPRNTQQGYIAYERRIRQDLHEKLDK